MESHFFPIGDLHIESMEQSKIFANYLNLRTEPMIVLLGDVIHFANSIWNPAVGQMSQDVRLQGLEMDASIWEDFLARLKVRTVYYLGSHEMFALRVIKNFLPSRKLKLTNEYVFIPNNLQIIPIGSQDDPQLLIGLNIPDNLQPDVEYEKFLQRKGIIEDWISKKTKDLNIPEPQKTILCSHDPCDIYYSNMGYRGLTQLLERWTFKAHYHAHIHSNIRDTVIGHTPSINRSFVALSKLNPQALEPSTSEIRSLYARDCLKYM